MDDVSSLVAIATVALFVNSCHVARKRHSRRSNIDNELRSSLLSLRQLCSLVLFELLND